MLLLSRTFPLSFSGQLPSHNREPLPSPTCTVETELALSPPIHPHITWHPNGIHIEGEKLPVICTALDPHLSTGDIWRHHAQDHASGLMPAQQCFRGNCHSTPPQASQPVSSHKNLARKTIGTGRHRSRVAQYEPARQIKRPLMCSVPLDRISLVSRLVALISQHP